MPPEEPRKMEEWYKGRRDCFLLDTCLPEEETYLFLDAIKGCSRCYVHDTGEPAAPS